MHKQTHQEWLDGENEPTVARPIEPFVSVPVEVLDLMRFMCATWTDIDKWAHKNMSVESIGSYPQIQGTSNQINLQRIGEQEYNTKNLHKAVEWMKAH